MSLCYTCSHSRVCVKSGTLLNAFVSVGLINDKTGKELIDELGALIMEVCTDHDFKQEEVKADEPAAS